MAGLFEVTRPQIHGYDMSCLAHMGPTQFISGMLAWVSLISHHKYQIIVFKCVPEVNTLALVFILNIYLIILILSSGSAEKYVRVFQAPLKVASSIAKISDTQQVLWEWNFLDQKQLAYIFSRQRRSVRPTLEPHSLPWAFPTARLCRVRRTRIEWLKSASDFRVWKMLPHLFQWTLLYPPVIRI